MVRAAGLAAVVVGLAVQLQGTHAAEVNVGLFGITVSDGPMVSGSGKTGEEKRALPAFSSLEVRAPVDVTLKAASVEQATLRGDDNVLPLIETRVVDGRLEIMLARGMSISTRHRAEVTVEFKQLNAIRISGSGDVRADTISTPVLEIVIGGAGDVRLDDVDLNALAVSVAGSGDVAARGHADSVGVVIEGSGDVDLSGVQAKQAAIRIHGSGDVTVSPAETLDVDLDGSGDVRYRGSPQIKKRVRGSGSVAPLK